MTISGVQRLILVMLAELHKANKVSSEIDSDFVLATAHSNQDWAFSWKYPSMFRDDSAQPAIVDETCNILDMYRRIASSLEELPQAERDRVAAESYPFSEYLKFRGFDFNNDPHASVVDHLVKHLDRYNEVNPDLNSHSSATIGQYRSMLERIEGLPPSGPSGRLNADQIISILKG